MIKAKGKGICSRVRLGVLLLSILGIFAFLALPLSREEAMPEIPASSPRPEMALQIARTTMPFVPNQGQCADEVKFSANLFSGSLFVTGKGLVYSLIKNGRRGEDEERKTSASACLERPETHGQPVVFREVFLDQQGLPVALIPQGENEAQARVSYFRGKDSSRWRSGLPTYNQVSLGRVYPQIEVNLKASGNNVEKVFCLLPGSNPEDIRIKVEGTQSLAVSPEKRLVLETEGGHLAMSAPAAYQEIAGNKEPIDVSYELRGDGVYGFRVMDEYDHSLPMIIDPALDILQASTFIGGGGGNYGHSIAADSAGNVYVSGYTYADDFPVTPGAYDTSFNASTDIFIAKLDPSLGSVLAATFIGSDSYDYGTGMALDGAGNVFITGETWSTDYPVTPGAYDESHNGYTDIFVSKLDGSLGSLLASTTLGGTSFDTGYSIVAADSGDVFVTGCSWSSDFPTVPGAYDTTFNSSVDAVVSKLDSSLSNLLASTFVGGTADEYGRSIALDNAGNVLVTGETASSDFPTTPGAYDESHNGEYDIFISKLPGSLTSLSASTVIGTSSNDYGHSVAVDTMGSVYITGETWSADYPVTPGAYDTSFNFFMDVVVTKLSGSLDSLLASTFLGGSSDDYGRCIALDRSGNVYITGYTKSAGYPVTPGAFDQTYNGGDCDIFVSELSASLKALVASTFIGGSDVDYTYSLAADLSGDVYITGYTSSTDYPSTPGAFDTAHNYSDDVFLSKLRGELHYVYDGNDFNGNGTSDVSVWRPSDGTWYIKDVTVQQWGTAGDIPCGGDYNGDGLTDAAVWRHRDGIWYVKNIASYQWGASGDIPVPGKYNADAITDIAVWRPADGIWYIKDIASYQWGAFGDIPVPGDYNGDGITDLAVWRLPEGMWYIKDIGYFQWGEPGDIPVPGDYNGDGVTDIAVWRPADGMWYVRNVGAYPWGVEGDVPVPGKYNSDAATDVAVWRPSQGRWFIKDIAAYQWGTAGDIPVVR